MFLTAWRKSTLFQWNQHTAKKNKTLYVLHTFNFFLPLHAGKRGDFVLSSVSYRLRIVLVRNSHPTFKDFSVWIIGVLWWGIIYSPPSLHSPCRIFTHLYREVPACSHAHIQICAHTQSRSCSCGTKAGRFCYISENKTWQAIIGLKLNEWLAILVCK